jgi:hypothetical protein
MQSLEERCDHECDGRGAGCGGEGTRVALRPQEVREGGDPLQNEGSSQVTPDAGSLYHLPQAFIM